MEGYELCEEFGQTQLIDCRKHAARADGYSVYSEPNILLNHREWVRCAVQVHGDGEIDAKDSHTRFHGTSFRAAVSIMKMGGVFLAGVRGHQGNFGVFSCSTLGEAWLRVAWQVDRPTPSMMAIVLEFETMQYKLYHPKNKNCGVTRGAAGAPVPGVTLKAIHINMAAVDSFKLLLDPSVTARPVLKRCWNFVRCGRALHQREKSESETGWYKSNKGHHYCPRCWQFWTHRSKEAVLHQPVTSGQTSWNAHGAV